MTAQILSPKSTRRLARDLDEPTITRAWVNNEASHDVVHFVTWDHEHGAFDRRGRVSVRLNPPFTHPAHCYDARGDLLLDCEPFVDDGRWPVQGYDR